MLSLDLIEGPEVKNHGYHLSFAKKVSPEMLSMCKK